MNTVRPTTFHLLARRLILAECMAALSLSSGVAQMHSASRPQKHQTAAQTSTAKNHPDIGERKFQQNCSRCHTTPEQLSPRITGTIVMHMRVRASLSDEDAKDILRYLSP